MNWKDGITTRAVLYDIAQLKASTPSIRNADPPRGPRSVGEESRCENRPGRHPLLYIGRREAACPQWGVNSPVAGYY
jgi:hypothetical protein